MSNPTSSNSQAGTGRRRLDGPLLRPEQAAALLT